MSRGNWLRRDRMISRERLLKAIRAKGFRFKRETRKSQIYARPADGIRVPIRKASLQYEKETRAILRAAGYASVEIEAFLAENRRA